jgi:hypothetical protein
LNRIIRWGPQSLLYEADPRHVEKLLRELDLEDCKSVSSPGVKAPSDTAKSKAKDGDESSLSAGQEKLDPERTRRYRSCTARCNYLAADRPDVTFPVKELCRAMSSPEVKHELALKRLARYLKGHPRLVQSIPFKAEMDTHLDAHVDSDWAGCRETRKSTNGGSMTVSGACVKAWSSTQAVLALSSGEAEYYAALKGASLALGMRSIAADLGILLSIRLHTDSAAAKGIMLRRGLGKMRHLEVGFLWLQSAVAEKRLYVFKCKGEENTADLGTKHLSGDVIDRHLAALGFKFEEGRSKVVPAS